MRVVLALLLTAATAIAAGTRALPDDPPAPAAVAPPPISSTFTDWLGHWSGPAQLVFPDGRVQRFETELVVARSDDPARLTWRIIYIMPREGGEPTRQERPYELVALDAAAGRYQIDEHNGIVVPTSLIGGTLYSCFTVQGNQISASYRLTDSPPDGRRLIIELVTTDAQRPSTTGDKAGSPPVIVLNTRSVQRAELSRRP